MSVPYFSIPFATSGDLLTGGVVPSALQPDGSISYTLGWGPDYELVDTAPGYKPVGRKEMNTMFNAVTSAVGEVQQLGFSLWRAAAAPYPINAIVRHNDVVYRSAVTNNSATPGTDATWTTTVAQTTLPVTGTAAAMVVSPAQPVFSYTGLRLPVQFSAASTPSTTINVSGVGAKSLRQYDSAGAKVPATTSAGQISDIVYDGTDFVLIDPLPPVVQAQRKQAFRGLSKNLKASSSGVSASVPVTADNVIVANSAGDAQAIGAVSATLNTSAVASATVDGMASGVTVASTWYAVYAWYSSTTGVTRVTGDSSFAAPTAPAAAFDMWALISVFRTDSTGNKFPLTFTQSERRWRYAVKSGTNLATAVVLASGSTGSTGPNTSLSLSVVAPPGVSVISATLTAQNGTSAQVGPSTNGAWNSLTNPPPLSVGAQATTFAVSAPIDVVLEQPNTLYWGASGATASLVIDGFEVPQ